MEDKDNMITSIDKEKAMDNIQHWFIIKTLSKVGIEGMGLNIRKAIHDKLQTSIILKGEKLEVFPLRKATKQECLLSPLLINTILEALARVIQNRSDQSLSRVRLFATPWIAVRQASLSITNSQSSLRLSSIESVMPSSHLILCRPISSCPQSLPASECFPMSHSSREVAKVLEFQL